MRESCEQAATQPLCNETAARAKNERVKHTMPISDVDCIPGIAFSVLHTGASKGISEH